MELLAHNLDLTVRFDPMGVALERVEENCKQLIFKDLHLGKQEIRFFAFFDFERRD